jgi:hypothetical protein
MVAPLERLYREKTPPRAYRSALRAIVAEIRARIPNLTPPRP